MLFRLVYTFIIALVSTTGDIFHPLLIIQIPAHSLLDPYLAVGLGGKVTYEESDYSLKGKLPYNKEISYNPFNPGQGYAVAPRFDWGATIEAGIEVKRVAFKVGYDLGIDKQYKGYAYNIGLNYHTASFTLGYTF